MAKSRREYFRKTRKIRMRELKHSKTGWIGLCCALTASILFVASVLVSFGSAGEAGFPVGSLCLIGLVLAAGAFILGVMAVRESKIRPVPPRTSIVLGAVMTVVLGCLYAFGMM